MGLGVKQEPVPAVVRVLRLIASSADCLGQHQIGRVIYRSGASGDLQAFRDNVMAIVRLPAAPERLLGLAGDLGDSAGCSSRLQHCYSLGSDRKQGQSPTDRMGGEASQIFGPH
jgi:hypothetical protein